MAIVNHQGTKGFMNWKFWQKQPPHPSPVPQGGEGEKRMAIDLFDPSWPEKKRALLARLADVDERDPLFTGYLGLLDQSLLVQIQRCEDPKLTDVEARCICNSIGIIIGQRADLVRVHKQERTRKANAAQQ